MGCQINLNPYLHRLTIVDPILPSSLKYTVTIIIVVTRLLYVQLWKSSQTPSEDMLFHKVRGCIEMERLASILNEESGEVLKMK